MVPKPEAQAFLDVLAALELPSLESLDVATIRAIFDSNDDRPPPPDVFSSEDRTIPGPAGDIGIRIVRPSADADLPVLVFFHGGGWVIGTLDSHDALCRSMANEAGCVVVSVDYRRAPEHRYPAAFDDCMAVTAWVADHGADISADTSRLAVGGDSAGGNLAAAVANASRDLGIALNAQLLIYPATNLAEPHTASYAANAEGYLLTAGWMDWFIEQYVPDVASRNEPNASPAKGILAGTAPAIVVTAEFDPLRDDGETYAKMLAAAGVAVELSYFAAQIHGFAAMIDVMEDARLGVEELSRFLTSRW